MRMPVDVAITDREDNMARLHRIDERRSRGCTAAVMRRYQNIGRELTRPRREHALLRRATDITGQQHRAVSASYPQHAGGIVRFTGVPVRRMQHDKLYAVPHP